MSIVVAVLHTKCDRISDFLQMRYTPFAGSATSLKIRIYPEHVSLTPIERLECVYIVGVGFEDQQRCGIAGLIFYIEIQCRDDLVQAGLLSRFRRSTTAVLSGIGLGLNTGNIFLAGEYDGLLQTIE